MPIDVLLNTSSPNFLLGRGEGTEVRHLVALKNNIAKEGGSLDFSIEEVTHGLVAGGYPRSKWIGRGNTTADEMMAQKPNGDPIDGALLGGYGSDEVRRACRTLKIASRHHEGTRLDMFAPLLGAPQRF